MIEAITVAELKATQDAGEVFRLIDVREPMEFQFAKLPGAELKPLGQINEWIKSLNKDEEIIMLCHHGMRSMQACQYLNAFGFTNLKNLSGGIDAWTMEIDSTVPRY